MSEQVQARNLTITKDSGMLSREYKNLDADTLAQYRANGRAGTSRKNQPEVKDGTVSVTARTAR